MPVISRQGDVGISDADSLGNLARGFTEDFQTPHHGKSSLLIGGKLFVTHAGNKSPSLERRVADINEIIEIFARRAHTGTASCNTR
jgi:hypothetical protein